jgi:hypothetical protein
MAKQARHLMANSLLAEILVLAVQAVALSYQIQGHTKKGSGGHVQKANLLGLRAEVFSRPVVRICRLAFRE